jgi:hypothetical protein
MQRFLLLPSPLLFDHLNCRRRRNEREKKLISGGPHSLNSLRSTQQHARARNTTRHTRSTLCNTYMKLCAPTWRGPLGRGFRSIKLIQIGRRSNGPTSPDGRAARLAGALLAADFLAAGRLATISTRARIEPADWPAPRTLVLASLRAAFARVQSTNGRPLPAPKPPATRHGPSRPHAPGWRTDCGVGGANRFVTLAPLSSPRRRPLSSALRRPLARRPVLLAGS